MPWTWATSCSSNWIVLLSPQILAFALTEAGGNSRTQNVERGFSESWLNKSRYSPGETWPDLTFPCEIGPRRHIAEPTACAGPFPRHLLLPVLNAFHEDLVLSSVRERRETPDGDGISQGQGARAHPVLTPGTSPTQAGSHLLEAGVLFWGDLVFENIHGFLAVLLLCPDTEMQMPSFCSKRGKQVSHGEVGGQALSGAGTQGEAWGTHWRPGVLQQNSKLLCDGFSGKKLQDLDHHVLSLNCPPGPG